MVRLWKRNILTLITPTEQVYALYKGNDVCSVTVGFCNRKAVLTNNPFIQMMQLLVATTW